MDTTDNFDAVLNAPQKTLQALYLNSNAKLSLQNEIAATFGRGVWVDGIGRYGQLLVRVADKPDIPSANDRLEPDKMAKYRGIETEGDGLRSYAAVCATLLLERRPLCLIDEPEMCLHPPQAYSIGRFIGKHVSEGTATVISTHSSHVLRGILEANPAAHVIRMSRTGSQFRARLLKPADLAEATSKPRSRAESILEGLFAQAVLMCESDGDRIVYESTYRTIDSRKIDIRFVTAEGTGGFADPLKLYTALGVPSAVVADLDFLDKDGELKSVLTALGTTAERIDDLCGRARTAMQHVKATTTQSEVGAVIDELKRISDPVKNAGEVEMTSLRGKLKRLSEKLNPLSSLKKNGVGSVAADGKRNASGEIEYHPRREVEDLIREFSLEGIFLLPVGELESWLPILMRGINPADKGKWAMLAAEKIEDTGFRDEDVWEFVGAVARYLCGSCALESIRRE